MRQQPKALWNPHLFCLIYVTATATSGAKGNGEEFKNGHF